MRSKKTPIAAPPNNYAYTIADVFEDVFAGQPYGRVPIWPPDVFCFAAAVLHQSGAYTKVDKKIVNRDFAKNVSRE